MVKARILTLPFDARIGCFDDQGMRHFLADKELVELRDHFFLHQGIPYLTIVLTYRSDGGTVEPAPAAKKDRRRESWRKLLEPGDMPLFNSLREWRSEKAKSDGVPPYVICTNLQLAEVVRARPRSLNKLGEIDGFGAAKLRKYGTEMLAHLGAGQAPPEGSHDG